MKVYISGPITNNPFYKKHFARAESELKEQGYTPINPGKIGEYEGLSYEDMMVVDFALLGVCDAIYMLKGWEDSKGANAELTVARVTGKQVMLEGSTMLRQDCLNKGIEELDLDCRAFNVLLRANKTKLKDIACLTIKQVERLRGCGVKTARRIAYAMNAIGVPLKEED